MEVFFFFFDGGGGWGGREFPFGCGGVGFAFFCGLGCGGKQNLLFLWGCGGCLKIIFLLFLCGCVGEKCPALRVRAGNIKQKVLTI